MSISRFGRAYKASTRRSKKIAWLTDDDLLRIKNLKLYKGGDGFLYALHYLDIMRKHRRLIRATIRPRGFSLFRAGHHPEPELLYPGTLEDGTLLWRIIRGSYGETKLTVDVALSGTSIANHWPIRDALAAFAKRAGEVIATFHAP